MDVPLPGSKRSWKQNLKPRLDIIALWLWGWGPMFSGSVLLTFLLMDSSVRALTLRTPSAPGLAFLAGYCWSVILHELCHYFAGLALGLRPFLVSWGHGDILWEWHWFGVTWTLRSSPYSGYVCALGESSTDPRWKHFCLTLAGPLTNVFIAILLGLILWSPPEWLTSLNLYEKSQTVALPFVLANCFIIVLVLCPSEHVIDGLRTESDGLSMFRTLRGRPKHSECAEKKDPDHNGVVSDPGDASSGPGVQWSLICKRIPAHYFLAHARYLLFRQELPAKEKEIQKDTFVTAVLMYGTRRYFAEAERYSEELVNQNPSSQTLRGTKGSILVVNGRLDEGIAMLESVYRESSSVIDRAISSAFLALGEFKRNNLAGAVRWLEESKRVDPNYPCIDLVERVIKKERAPQEKAEG